MILDHVVTDIDGKPAPLAAWRGKVLLVVNVASECGNTPQYKGLEALWRKYQDRGLVVIGFPSNDFGGQEPRSNADVKAFACERYDVTFPLMAKVKVKGKDAAPLYLDLQKVGRVEWNFHKFLVDREGRVVGSIADRVKPESKELVAAIEGLL